MTTESLYGYVLRVAAENCYSTPWSLLSHAGIQRDRGLINAGLDVAKLAELIGRPIAQLQPLAYTQDTNARRPVLLGQRLRGSHLRIGRPHVCPECIKDSGFAAAAWDCSLVLACTKHRKRLVHVCRCGQKVGWYRPHLLACACGGIESPPDQSPLPQDLLDLTEIIVANIERRTPANCPAGAPAAELAGMELRRLLATVVTLGKEALRQGGREVAGTKTELVVPAAAGVFAAWPTRYHGLLENMSATRTGRFTDRAYPVYQGLFRSTIGPGRESIFWKEFVNFGLANGSGHMDSRLTEGAVAGRYLSLRDYSRHCGIDYVDAQRFLQRGIIKATTFQVGGVVRYMVDLVENPPEVLERPEPIKPAEAAAMLEVPKSVIRSLKEKGYFAVPGRYVKASQVSRIGVLALKARLLAAIPTLACAPTESSESLWKALKQRKFSGAHGKGDFVADIIEGRVKVLGRTGDSLKDIYVDTTLLPKYIASARVRASGTLNLTQVARRLSLDVMAVSTLVDQGVLKASLAIKYKRVYEDSVREFDSKFVALCRIASEACISSRLLQRLCKEEGIELQAVERKGMEIGPQRYLDREFEGRVRLIATSAAPTNMRAGRRAGSVSE